MLREAVEGEVVQDTSSLSLSLLMGWCMPGKWACPDWPGSSFSPATGMTMLIISFSSRVNVNNTVLAFCQHRVNKAHVSCTSPSFWFLSGDPMLSGIVGGNEMGVDGWGVEGYQSSLSCSWSREKSCRWLAGCLRSNMARGKGSTQEGWDNHHFWVESCTICGFFFLALYE